MSSSVKIVTHDSSFHSDDVFAVATLVLMLGGEKYEILRTRDPLEIESADYVVDVGEVYDADKNRFDHHQEGRAGQRENGVPYASFGLVWKKFGEKVCDSKEVADKIDRILVQPIDAIDNGFEIEKRVVSNVRSYNIGDYINSFVPTWKEDPDFDLIFNKVVDIALNLLKREIKIHQDVLEASIVLEDIYKNTEDKRIFVLDKKISWGEFVSTKKEVLFVVSPKDDGSWVVKTTRDDLNSFKNRKSLPKEWGGKRGEDLVYITGVKDAVFCHAGLFIAFASTKEGALDLAKLALEK